MHIIRDTLDRTAQTQVDAFCADHGVQLRRLETISRNFNSENEFNPTTFPYSTSPEHEASKQPIVIEAEQPKGIVFYQLN